MLVRVCLQCGKQFGAYPYSVRKGQARYCTLGCRFAAKKRVAPPESRGRLYTMWSDMKSRCSNPNNAGFAYYGGRGVTVCDAWRDSYLAFREWAHANGYAPGLELDRRDTDGGYSPDNCRFANRQQQMCNTRKRRDARTSKYKGVSREKRSRKWRAQIGYGRRTLYIGMFDTEEQAAAAYDEAAARLFGEFARVNFPSQGGGSS